MSVLRSAGGVFTLIATSVGCSSFGTAEPPPSNPTDAGDAEVSDAHPFDPDPCASFSPPPVRYPDPANACGPGIDVRSNPAHCGVCGRACVTGACVEGLCATQLAGSLASPFGAAGARVVGVSGGWVYYSNTTSLRHLVRTAIDNPGNTDLVADTGNLGGDPNETSFSDAIVDKDAIYLRGNGRLMRVGHDGGSIVQSVGLPPDSGLTRVALSDQHVYVLWDDRLQRTPKSDDENVRVVASTQGGREVVVARDDSEIFFTDSRGLFRRRGTDEVRIVDAPANGEMASLLLDAEYVYWIELPARILWRLPRVAAPGASPSKVTDLLFPLGIESYRTLHISNDYVYFVRTTDGGSHGAIERVHRCGGDVLRVSEQLQQPFAFVAEGAHLYYSGAGPEVRRTTR